MNAADVGMCGLEYSAVRRGRIVVLPAYLDDRDDLTAILRLDVSTGGAKSLDALGPSR